ncbi:hypothetical protein [uncultured Kordia sp.]|uniref:hypothetical protein n=1 Tax=uncultured Kordia sp. TaxID=507699 RepID=UPI00261C4C90|nr:hypothetical protein [uncultured Kordia sp.]
MKFKYTYLLLASCLFISCGKDTTQNKNYLSDISIDNNKLSCDGIIMENHTGIINKSEFTYGEKINLFYDNMTGFSLQDSLAYPDMDIFVMNKKGDTIFSQKDLLKNTTEGFTEEKLNLTSNLTFALPMLPKKSYLMNFHITDKHGDGYFNLKKNFSIIENPLLKTETNGFTYDILYLYSQSRNIAVVDNKIKPEENIYILLENLEGYEIDENGKVDLNASISLVSSNGTVINKQENLFPTPVSAKDLKDQLYATLSISKGYVKNPVTCIFEVMDNKSKHSIKTTFDLIVEE